MKIPIKKYWWIALVILLLPITINFVLLIPSFTAIVGDEIAWLSFWGGYLGAIISTAAAFIILYIQRKDNESENEKNRVDNEVQNKQNREENEKLNRANRQLQLNIMKYHQQCHWLDNFRNASIEYSHAFNYNDIVIISNIMWDRPKDAFNLFKEIADRIIITHTKFKFAKSHENHPTFEEITKLHSTFTNAFNIIQHIILFFIATDITKRTPQNFQQFIQNQGSIDKDAESILNILSGFNVNIESNRVYFNKLFESIMSETKDIEFQISKKLLDYSAQEQKRISCILTTDLEEALNGKQKLK